VPGEPTSHIELDSQIFFANTIDIKGTIFFILFPPNVSYRVSKEISVRLQTVLKLVKIPKSAVKRQIISQFKMKLIL